MNKQLLRLPIVLLWSSAAALGLKLIKLHLLRHGLFDTLALSTLTQVKVVVLVTVLSALAYEALLLINYINFGDEDDPPSGPE